MTEQELCELLKNVFDSYPDFVSCGIDVAKKHNSIDEIGNFIKNNPEAKTSDVILYVSEEIAGFKTVSE